MLFWLLKDHNTVLVAVRTMSNLDAKVSNVTDGEALEADNLDGLAFAFPVLTKDNDVLDLKPIDIRLHFATLDLAIEFHINFLAHVARLVVGNGPYFSMEGRVIAFVQLLMRLDPVAEVVVAQPSIFLILVHVDAMLKVDLLRELLYQGAHVTVFNFELQLVLVYFQVRALVMYAQKSIIGLIEGSCRLFIRAFHVNFDHILL